MKFQRDFEPIDIMIYNEEIEGKMRRFANELNKIISLNRFRKTPLREASIDKNSMEDINMEIGFKKFFWCIGKGKIVDCELDLGNLNYLIYPDNNWLSPNRYNKIIFEVRVTSDSDNDKYNKTKNAIKETVEKFLTRIGYGDIEDIDTTSSYGYKIILKQVKGITIYIEVKYDDGYVFDNYIWINLVAEAVKENKNV